LRKKKWIKTVETSAGEKKIRRLRLGREKNPPAFSLEAGKVDANHRPELSERNHGTSHKKKKQKEINHEGITPRRRGTECVSARRRKGERLKHGI